MLKIFSVYDSKAEAFLNPIFCPTRAVAIRSFTASAINPDSDFCRHPEDFSLFELGEFDPATGILKEAPKVLLGSAQEFSDATRSES